MFNDILTEVMQPVRAPEDSTCEFHMLYSEYRR
jgi:hypothetical protein